MIISLNGKIIFVFVAVKIFANIYSLEHDFIIKNIFLKRLNIKNSHV